MIITEAPKVGTPEWDLWASGATAEHRLAREGMRDDAKEIYECVESLAQKGESGNYLAMWVPYVFTADWTWRRRLGLAWKLVKPSRPRRTVKVYFDRRDWWVGYYRGDTHHYVCPLPTVVIRWKRR